MELFPIPYKVPSVPTNNECVVPTAKVSNLSIVAPFTLREIGTELMYRLVPAFEPQPNVIAYVPMVKQHMQHIKAMRNSILGTSDAREGAPASR